MARVAQIKYLRCGSNDTSHSGSASHRQQERPLGPESVSGVGARIRKKIQYGLRADQRRHGYQCKIGLRADY